MVKEEKKDKLIAHHTKTGAGGDLAALDDTEDLGGARKSEYKAEPDMPEMSEESITRAATAATCARGWATASRRRKWRYR